MAAVRGLASSENKVLGGFSATPGVGLLRMARPEPMKMSKMEMSLEDVLDMVAEVACGGCAVQVRKLQSSAIALQKCCGCVTACEGGGRIREIAKRHVKMCRKGVDWSQL